MNKQQIENITKVIEEAVNDGIKLAVRRTSELKSKNFNHLYLPKHEDFPSIFYLSSGLPHFSTTPAYYGYKINYKKILAESKEDIEMESWKNLIEVFMNDERLFGFIDCKDWNPPEEETRKEIFTLSLLETLRSLVDSIIHNTKNQILDKKIKRQKILSWVSALTKTAVNYNLVIPIIYYQPDCKSLTLTKDIKIEKLSEKFQLSRHFRLPENTVAHKNVIGAATHGIIISNLLTNIPNDNQWTKYSIIKERINKNFDLISKIFSTIRLVINDSIGFCQVIAKPMDFEEYWFADLPSLTIFGYKKYPPYFEESGWHDKKVISKKQLALIKRYINQKSDDKKIKLAQRKLFDSDLREKTDDSVLDITTGLESLLSDSTDNLKYKVSLRSAAICKKKKLFEFNPVEIKIGIKTLYDLRSAIIHGNIKDLKKKRNVILERSQPIDTLWFGRNVLKHLIEFFLVNPDFIDVDKIDNYLLEDK